MCDWMVMIDEGSCLFQGPTSQLLTGGGIRLIVAPQHQEDIPRLGELLAWGGHRIESRDDHFIIAVDGTDHQSLAAELNVAAMNGGVVLVELRTVATTLEDRYLAMVAGENQ